MKNDRNIVKGTIDESKFRKYKKKPVVIEAYQPMRKLK